MDILSILIFLIILTNQIADCQYKPIAEKYCRLSKEHTFCKYKTNSMGPKCPPEDKLDELTEREKSVLIKVHNSYRSSVAKGDKRRFSCPPGSDILHLEWDAELALMAERWAMQCPRGPDTFRNVERFEVGQNFYLNLTANSTDETFGVLDVLTSWYNEYQYMTHDKFMGDTFEKCERFSQMVWGETKFIGCAKNVWKDKNGGFIKFAVCNYGPKGNFLGTRMYTPGEACSKCPQGNKVCTTEENHDGLCARGDKGTMNNPKIEYLSFGIISVILINGLSQ